MERHSDAIRRVPRDAARRAHPRLLVKGLVGGDDEQRGDALGALVGERVPAGRIDPDRTLLVSSAYPRPGRGVAATRLRGISARRTYSIEPWSIFVHAARSSPWTCAPVAWFGSQQLTTTEYLSEQCARCRA